LSNISFSPEPSDQAFGADQPGLQVGDLGAKGIVIGFGLIERQAGSGVIALVLGAVRAWLGHHA
jgi:hypothetical protein